MLLAREAGAAVFDARGEPYGPQSDSTLAATFALRDTLIEVMTAAMAMARG